MSPPNSVIVEITGTEDKIESLVELLRPLGILEMVRTGQVAMMRGNATAWHAANDNQAAQWQRVSRSRSRRSLLHPCSDEKI